jgi:ribosomal protein S24E
VTYDGTTPSREDVKTKAHLHIDDDKDQLIIRNFPSKQRGNQFTVQARQYHDEDAMQLLEHDAMVDKNNVSNHDNNEDEEGDES